jgi:hypothetical protein
MESVLSRVAMFPIWWLAKGDVVGQRRFIHALFGIAACSPDTSRRWFYSISLQIGY